MSGLLLANRRIILTPKNPLDVSTVVSIYRRTILETKPTLFPGTFEIPGGSPEKPSIIHVGASSWFREVNEDEPLLEIPVSSIILAESIVRDWRIGVHMNGVDANPGLIFYAGQITEKQMKESKEYKLVLDQAIEHQKNWFKLIVKDADVLWARSNGNPIVISDDARWAAERLGLKEKSWMQDFQAMEMANCPACGALRNPNFPICGNCKTIVDAVKYKALGLGGQA